MDFRTWFRRQFSHTIKPRFPVCLCRTCSVTEFYKQVAEMAAGFKTFLLYAKLCAGRALGYVTIPVAPLGTAPPLPPGGPQVYQENFSCILGSKQTNHGRSQHLHT